MRAYLKPFCFLALLFLAFSSGMPPAQASAQEGKVLHVGVLADSPPLSFSQGVYPQKEWRGLAVELAVMLNTSLGYSTEFHAGDLEDLKLWLANGTIDYACAIPMVAANTLTGNSYVVTSFALNRKILVHNTNMHISGTEDFKRRKIAFLKRDNFHTKLDVLKMDKVFVNTYREGLRALSNGEVDAFVPPCSEIATYISQREEHSPVIIMGVAMERIPLLLVFPLDAPLKISISEVISAHENSGALDILRNKWLGKETYKEPTLWEEYQNAILSSIGALVALIVLVVVWTFILRKEVARVTRRLRYTEESYEALFDASPDMVLMLDTLGNVKLANRAARFQLFKGKAPAEGDSLFPFLDTPGKEKLVALIRDTGEGKNQQTELTLHPKNGPLLTLELNIFHTWDTQSGLPRICCIARDISGRLRIEKELIQAERLVVIGKMAAGIAHEVNNPLNIILTNAELMQEMTNDKDMEPCLHAILQSVDRAAHIIRQLLELAAPARMEAIPLNLYDIIIDCLALLKPRMKNVRIDLGHLPKELPILGDKQQLEQVLLNLVLNALASMKEHGELRIAGRLDTSKTDTVRVTVQDSGQGIKKEHLEKIFDLFFTTRNREGFGLGLFISRCIVERHEGLLFAESVQGQGATFFLELPIRK